jgi:hypothetical protein
MQNQSNQYAASGEISAGILEKLGKTRPWVLLIGILLLIGAAFTAVAAISIAVVGTWGGGQGGFPTAMGIGVGVAYLIGAILYLFLGIYLLKYSGAIKRSGSSGSSADVAEAIGYQHAFWRLAGILALLMIAFTVVMLAVGIVGGISGVMMTH